jgi:AcrR family transcriptional regulator
MTAIPARLLRPQAEQCPSRPPLREQDRQRRAYILEAAEKIFATHGRANITLKNFAIAISLSEQTMRRHATDLHHLFGIVLTRHLDAILAAIGQIPAHRQDRRRAEYLRLIRETHTDTARLHILFLRERFTLPPDQLEPLEQQRRIIGHLVGGNTWEATLALLDCPTLSPDTIESMLAAGAQTATPQPAAPEPRRAAIFARPVATPPVPTTNKPSHEITKPNSEIRAGPN